MVGAPGPASAVLRYLRGGCGGGCLCGKLCEPCRKGGDCEPQEGTVLRVTPERVVLRDGRVFPRPGGAAYRPGQRVIVDCRPGLTGQTPMQLPRSSPVLDEPFVPPYPQSRALLPRAAPGWGGSTYQGGGIAGVSVSYDVGDRDFTAPISDSIWSVNAGDLFGPGAYMEGISAVAIHPQGDALWLASVKLPGDDEFDNRVIWGKTDQNGESAWGEIVIPRQSFFGMNENSGAWTATPDGILYLPYTYGKYYPGETTFDVLKYLCVMYVTPTGPTVNHVVQPAGIQIDTVTHYPTYDHGLQAADGSMPVRVNLVERATDKVVQHYWLRVTTAGEAFFPTGAPSLDEVNCVLGTDNQSYFFPKDMPKGVLEVGRYVHTNKGRLLVTGNGELPELARTVSMPVTGWKKVGRGRYDKEATQWFVYGDFRELREPYTSYDDRFSIEGWTPDTLLVESRELTQEVRDKIIESGISVRVKAYLPYQVTPYYAGFHWVTEPPDYTFTEEPLPIKEVQGVVSSDELPFLPLRIDKLPTHGVRIGPSPDGQPSGFTFAPNDPPNGMAVGFVSAKTDKKSELWTGGFFRPSERVVATYSGTYPNSVAITNKKATIVQALQASINVI